MQSTVVTMRAFVRKKMFLKKNNSASWDNSPRVKIIPMQKKDGWKDNFNVQYKSFAKPSSNIVQMSWMQIPMMEKQENATLLNTSHHITSLAFKGMDIVSDFMILKKRLCSQL